MKTLCLLVKIAIGSFAGVFLGRSAFLCMTWLFRPETFLVYSAPWYLSIQLNASFTAGILSLLFLALFLLEKKGKPQAPMSKWTLFSALSLIGGLCSSIWLVFDFFGYHPQAKPILMEVATCVICFTLALLFRYFRKQEIKS